MLQTLFTIVAGLLTLAQSQKAGVENNNNKNPIKPPLFGDAKNSIGEAPQRKNDRQPSAVDWPGRKLGPPPKKLGAPEPPSLPKADEAPINLIVKDGSITKQKHHDKLKDGIRRPKDLQAENSLAYYALLDLDDDDDIWDLDELYWPYYYYYWPYYYNTLGYSKY